jgi:hypothetical protein
MEDLGKEVQHCQWEFGSPVISSLAAAAYYISSTTTTTTPITTIREVRSEARSSPFPEAIFLFSDLTDG